MNTNRLPGLIVAVLIIATVALGWFVGISPIVTQIAQANVERQNVEALNVTHQAQLDLLKKQYEEMPELTKELADLQKSIPGTVASDDFVDELQAIASVTGVSITNVTLSEAVLYGTSADGTAPAAVPTTTDESGDTAATNATIDTEPTAPPVDAQPVVGQPVTPGAELDGKFYTVPVSLNVNGPAPGVVAFLALCQQSPRLFLLTKWSITGYDSVATVAITGHTFVVHDPAAVALELEASDSDAEATTDVATDPTPTPTETPTP